MTETLSNWIFYMTFEVLTEVMDPVFWKPKTRTLNNNCLVLGKCWRQNFNPSHNKKQDRHCAYDI